MSPPIALEPIPRLRVSNRDPSAARLGRRSDPEIEPMYPASTPLVPDDHLHERDFAPRDLDAERDLQCMRRPVRQNAIRKSSVASRMVRSVSRFFAAVLIGVAGDGRQLDWGVRAGSAALNPGGCQAHNIAPKIM